MSNTDIDRYVDRTAVYVHIPFCARICPYCDFAVVAGKEELVDRYIDALLAEIELTASWAPLHSVYFGGGTPSQIDPAHLGRVLARLEGHHGIDPEAEVSLEANPEDFDPDRARHLRALGFNRVSFGAQSMDGQVLQALGRRHLPADVVSAVDAARGEGFENISVDLIYGTPGETSESWGGTLAEAIRLGPDHISCYALTVERGTPLGRSVRDGAPAPDPDIQADRYEHAQRVLGDAGFEQYEVSNWAKPGKRCSYNLTVWAQGEYLAYGNGAHGYLGQHRFRNIRRVEAYIGAVEGGSLPRAGEDLIEGWAKELDRLFVGLRRNAGVAHGPGTAALLESSDGQLLLDARVLEDTGSRLVIKRPLLTDAVHRAVLGLEPQLPSGDHA